MFKLLINQLANINSDATYTRGFRSTDCNIIEIEGASNSLLLYLHFSSSVSSRNTAAFTAYNTQYSNTLFHHNTLQLSSHNSIALYTTSSANWQSLSIRNPCVFEEVLLAKSKSDFLILRNPFKITKLYKQKKVVGSYFNVQRNTPRSWYIVRSIQMS